MANSKDNEKESKSSASEKEAASSKPTTLTTESTSPDDGAVDPTPTPNSPNTGGPTPRPQVSQEASEADRAILDLHEKLSAASTSEEKRAIAREFHESVVAAAREQAGKDRADVLLKFGGGDAPVEEAPEPGPAPSWREYGIPEGTAIPPEYANDPRRASEKLSARLQAQNPYADATFAGMSKSAPYPYQNEPQSPDGQFFATPKQAASGPSKGKVVDASQARSESDAGKSDIQRLAEAIVNQGRETRTPAQATYGLDTTVAGGKYIEFGRFVDANGEPLHESKLTASDHKALAALTLSQRRGAPVEREVGDEGDIAIA